MFDRDAERLFRNHLYKGILDQLDAPLPEAFLKRWMKSVNENPLSDDDVNAQYPDYARYVKWQIFEDAVVKKHGVEVSHEDVVNEAKAQVAMQYSRYGIPLDDSMLNSFAQNVINDRKEYDRLRDSLRENRMFEALIASLKLKDKEVSYDKFVEIAQQDAD
jgi:trigger factor